MEKTKLVMGEEEDNILVDGNGEIGRKRMGNARECGDGGLSEYKSGVKVGLASLY